MIYFKKLIKKIHECIKDKNKEVNMQMNENG